MKNVAKMLALMILVAIAMSSCSRGFGCPYLITKGKPITTNQIKNI